MSVRRARLVSGRHGVTVPLAKVRRGARRGLLRLPHSVLGAHGEGRRIRRAARRVRLKLTVTTSRRPAGIGTGGAGQGRDRRPADGNAEGAIIESAGAPAASPGTPGSAASPGPGHRSALAGVKLHVETDSSARRQAEAWRSTRPLDAAHMDRIAAGPQATWFGEWSGDVRSAVSQRVRAAVKAGAVPVLVAYNIPQRDCGSHSAGGAASADGYRTWIREFAAGIAGGSAIVVLEPDALAGMDCLSSGDRTQRLALLEDAVSVLASQGSVAAYVDAGHSAWQPAAVMASRLESVGAARVNGFALNVANFRATDDEVAYGQAIATLSGGKTFVVDTSRNGPGTASSEWCNPLERALGRAPATDTGLPFVDAYLWIKRPGESDGTCNGGPPAGGWWPEYALGLAQRGL